MTKSWLFSRAALVAASVGMQLSLLWSQLELPLHYSLRIVTTIFIHIAFGLFVILVVWCVWVGTKHVALRIVGKRVGFASSVVSLYVITNLWLFFFYIVLPMSE